MRFAPKKQTSWQVGRETSRYRRNGLFPLPRAQGQTCQDLCVSDSFDLRHYLPIYELPSCLIKLGWCVKLALLFRLILIGACVSPQNLFIYFTSFAFLIDRQFRNTLTGSEHDRVQPSASLRYHHCCHLPGCRDCHTAIHCSLHDCEVEIDGR